MATSAETGTATGTATWQLDPTHSSVEFSVKHMMMTTVRGRFKEVQATLRGDRARPQDARIEVTINTASIDTGTADRDAHLRGADFFDAEQFPTISFTGKRVEGVTGEFREEGEKFRLVGDLKIRDTTIEVTLDCRFEGRGKDPWGKDRVGFTAQGEIDRRDWGLRWNQAIETGGVLVANRVKIDVEAQFVRA